MFLKLVYLPLKLRFSSKELFSSATETLYCLYCSPLNIIDSGKRSQLESGFRDRMLVDLY